MACRCAPTSVGDGPRFPGSVNATDNAKVLQTQQLADRIQLRHPVCLLGGRPLPPLEVPMRLASPLRIAAQLFALSTPALVTACSDSPVEPSPKPAFSLSPAKTFTTIDLGQVNRPSEARAINAAGQVVGDEGSSGDLNGFVWESGTLTIIHPDVPRTSPVIAAALGNNAQGQVVGFVQFLTGGGVSHAYLWDDGVMTNLGTLPGGNASFGLAINRRGEVVGSATTASGAIHAFLWAQGTMVDLGTLPGGASSAATAINSRGGVVGTAPTGRGAPPALLRGQGTL